MKSSTDLLKQAEKLELEGIKQAEKLEELEGIIQTDTKPPISVTEPSSNTPIVSNLTDDPTSKKETTSSQTSVVAETTKDSNMPTIQRPKKEMIDPLASIKDPLASIKDKAAKEVKTHTDEIDKQMESLKYRREKEEDIRISNAKDEKRIELFKDRKAKEEAERLAKEEEARKAKEDKARKAKEDKEDKARKAKEEANTQANKEVIKAKQLIKDLEKRNASQQEIKIAHEDLKTALEQQEKLISSLLEDTSGSEEKELLNARFQDVKNNYNENKKKKTIQHTIKIF